MTLKTVKHTEKVTKEQKCPKCLYRWETRVQEPKACPRCKTRLDAPNRSSTL